MRSRLWLVVHLMFGGGSHRHQPSPTITKHCCGSAGTGINPRPTQNALRICGFLSSSAQIAKRSIGSEHELVSCLFSGVWANAASQAPWEGPYKILGGSSDALQ